MSNFPASSTEATVVPLALSLSGRPRIVGTVVWASKNIMLLLKVFLPPFAIRSKKSMTFTLSISSFSQLISLKLASLISLPNIFTERAPDGWCIRLSICKGDNEKLVMSHLSKWWINITKRGFFWRNNIFTNFTTMELEPHWKPTLQPPRFTSDLEQTETLETGSK